jgi:hypothetical protein
MPGHFTTLWKSHDTSTLSGQLAREVAEYIYSAGMESIKCMACTYGRYATASTSEVLDSGIYGPAVCIYLSLPNISSIHSSVAISWHCKNSNLSCSIYDPLRAVQEGGQVSGFLVVTECTQFCVSCRYLHKILFSTTVQEKLHWQQHTTSKECTIYLTFSNKQTNYRISL